MANADVAPAAHKLLPILEPGYRRDWLLPDVLAGLVHLLPLIFHPATTRARDGELILHRLFHAYRESSDDRRVLLETRSMSLWGNLHWPIQIKPSVIMPHLRSRCERANLLPVRSSRLGFWTWLLDLAF